MIYPSSYLLQKRHLLDTMEREWKAKGSLYLGKLLIILQWILDSILDFVFGYTTRFGWRKERETARKSYKKSAQLVTDKLSLWMYSITYFALIR